MREYIVNYCNQKKDLFSALSDTGIYAWLCDNFWCKDYELLRQCSIELFGESRKKDKEWQL